MRTVMNNSTGMWIAGLVLLAICLTIIPLRPQQKILYPLVRKAAQAKMDYETRHMAVYQTANFTIK